MNRVLIAAAFAALPALSATAETYRFSFATEANLSGTLANNSWSQNESGTYSGIITTVTGLNAQVSGYLDIDRRTGQPDQIVGFSLNVITPHGVAPGFGDPDYTTQYYSSVDMSVPNGGSGILDNGALYLSQVAQFDPFYGPKVGGSHSPTPYYDSNLRQDYPFLQTVTLVQVGGAGPDGSASYAVRRVDFSCYQYPGGGSGASGCNGYYQGNHGIWDGSDGLASSYALAPAATVPLPAGAALLLGALAGLGALGRRRQRAA